MKKPNACKVFTMTQSCSCRECVERSLTVCYLKKKKKIPLYPTTPQGRIFTCTFWLKLYCTVIYNQCWKTTVCYLFWLEHEFKSGSLFDVWMSGQIYINLFCERVEFTADMGNLWLGLFTLLQPAVLYACPLPLLGVSADGDLEFAEVIINRQ